MWECYKASPFHSSSRVTIIVYLSASSTLTHKLPEVMWWSGGGIVPLVVIPTTPSVEFNDKEELAMQSRIPSLGISCVAEEKELIFLSLASLVLSTASESGQMVQVDGTGLSTTSPAIYRSN